MKLSILSAVLIFAGSVSAFGQSTGTSGFFTASDKLPKAQGRDAEAMDRFRSRVATARPTTATPAARAATPPAAPSVDLSKLAIPIIDMYDAQ
jgi:hypothetical protein